MRGANKNILYTKKLRAPSVDFSVAVRPLYKSILSKVQTGSEEAIFEALSFLEREDFSSEKQDAERQKLVDEIITNTVHNFATKKERHTRNQVILNLLYLHKKDLIILDDDQVDGAFNLVSRPRISDIQTYMCKALVDRLLQDNKASTLSVNTLQVNKESHITQKGFKQKNVLCKKRISWKDNPSFSSDIIVSCTDCQNTYNNLSFPDKRELMLWQQATELSETQDWRISLHDYIDELVEEKITVQELSNYIWDRKDEYVDQVYKSLEN